MQPRWYRIAVLVCLEVWVTTVRADPPDPAADEIRAVARLIDRNSEVQRIFRSCPADAYKGLRGFLSPGFGEKAATDEHCDKEPARCYGLCTSLGSAGFCFATARALEREQHLVAPRYSQMLYAYACALGRSSGCTNRAAGIRNTNSVGDPFRGLQLTEQHACEFRTFAISCGLGDAWGCAMLGQAFQNGEGVAVSMPQAKAAFEKSCRINPRFDACAFARRELQRGTAAPRR